MSGRESITSPHSKYRGEVLKQLKNLKYISDYHISGDVIKSVKVELLYHDLVPAVTGVKFFSTPGRRVYTASKDLKPVLGGMGHSILSTSVGILTNIEARKKRLGGELLFSIW